MEALRVTFDRILRNFRLGMCAPHPRESIRGDVWWRHFWWKVPHLGRYCPTSGCVHPFWDDPLQGHVTLRNNSENADVEYYTTYPKTPEKRVGDPNFWLGAPKGTPFGVTWLTSLPVNRPDWGGYCATFGCTCAHPREPPSGSRDLGHIR